MSRGEPTPERVVDHLLERLSKTVDLLFDQPGHVGVERQRRSHEDIMMLRGTSVKMHGSSRPPTTDDLPRTGQAQEGGEPPATVFSPAARREAARLP